MLGMADEIWVPIKLTIELATSNGSEPSLGKAVLGVSLARLKSASDFKYAPDPLAVARSI
jgi:hypothetical protein